MASRNVQPPDRSAEPRGPTKSSRRDRHKAEIRDRLFRSAIGLYMTRGLQATTVRDITEAADVGKGTFFNYFPTKEHVLAEFYERQNGRVQDALQAVRNGEPFRQAMMGMRRRLTQEAQSRALTRSFLLALVSNSAVFEMVMPHLQATRAVSAELLKVGQQRGEVRTDQPATELARAVQELAFGSALFWLCHPETSLDQLLDANFDLVCAPQASAMTGSANGVSRRFSASSRAAPEGSGNTARGSKRRPGRPPLRTDASRI